MRISDWSSDVCSSDLHPAEIESLDHQVDLRAPPPAAQPVSAREEGEVLADGQIAVEREFLRHVAEPLARLGGGAAEIEAGHASIEIGRAACRESVWEEG